MGDLAVTRCSLKYLLGKPETGVLATAGHRNGPDLNEQRARRTVTILAIVSLALLALGIVYHLQGLFRHAARIQQQQFVSLLQLAANGLSGAVQEGDTVRVPLAEDLRRVLPAHAFEHGRQFVIVDAEGRVQAIVAKDEALPISLQPGAPLPQPLRRIALAADGTVRPLHVRLSENVELLVGAVPLGAWPGTVLLVQGRNAWSLFSGTHAGVLLALFVGALGVIVGLAAAYNRQSVRAEEEDRKRVDFIARLESALQLGRCGLWDWDISRGRIQLSPSMQQLLKLPPREGYMDLKDFLALQHPEEPPIDQLLEEGLSKGSPTFEHELRLRQADGRWIWVKMRGALPETTSDGVYHLVGIAVDITEQKQASDAVRHAEQRLTQAIESISESFALWDAHMRMVTCNSKFREIFGLPKDACKKGLTLDEVMRAARNPVRKRHAPRIVGEGKDQETIAELELADGRWLQISERRMPGGGIVSVGTDITELKRKQMELENSRRELEAMVEELEQSRQEIADKNVRLNTMARHFHRAKERAEDALRIKAQFLANVSHELFTPLNHIMASADAMRHEVLGDLSEIYREYADQIHRAGKEVQRKISDMLVYAELSSGGDELELQDANIAELIAEAGESFMVEAEEKGVQLSWRAPQGLRGRVDANLLRRALAQLVSNAVRFTNEGEVLIHAGMTEKGELVVEVRDTGMGIPEEKIARIGQPFERAGHAYNSHSGGSGIGLAIVKAVAEKHEGRFEIDSREGAGTQARLIMPHAYMASETTPGSREDEATGSSAEGATLPDLFDDD